MGRCEAGLTCDATAMTCTMPPAAPPAGGMCFYSSGCSYAEGEPTALALCVLGVLLAVVVSRRRRQSES
jgi:uncharacterized protein (TIGR03382 family)